MPDPDYVAPADPAVEADPIAPDGGHADPFYIDPALFPAGPDSDDIPSLGVDDPDPLDD